MSYRLCIRSNPEPPISDRYRYLGSDVAGDCIHLLRSGLFYRLYAVPYADAAQAPLPKDRLGLVLKKDDATFTVQFVAPDSPSQAAGSKVGDKITKIDGKQPTAWSEASIVDLKYGVIGSSLGFTMQDGNVRHVKLADYF